jgi:colicin import membrane protein
MRTIHDVQSQSSSRPGSDEDPFRYGWRYVKRERPDGTVEFDQVPLTPEDLLFPEEGDFAVQTDMHVEDYTYLRTIFKTKMVGNPQAVVLADCRVDFNVPGLRPLGPDVIVLFGLTGPRRNWGTFHVGQEHSKPALVIEVASPDTRTNDLELKVEYYHQAGVPLYVIVDAHEPDDYRRLELIGLRWTPKGYEPVPPNEQGRLWLDPVGLWLGIAPIEAGYGERVACYDPETGKEIGDYVQISQALRQAESRAEQAESRAEQAESRAEQEARARAELETRLKAMEEEIRRLGGRAPGQS